MRSARWLLLLLGLSLTLSASAAKDPNEKTIKARQAVMTLQSWYAGPLFQMAKGEFEYDVQTAKTYALHPSTMANVEAGAMWADGSDNETYADMNGALPELWSTWPEVSEKAEPGCVRPIDSLQRGPSPNTTS